ncbi:MAG: hypothetical protein OJF60_002375 [Burkholderiaceae bacterium]|jgi:hypothetical protein|nr:MAG: hypothetical protein OJF60_002375 [Burkholderiaceae bacterium]
MTSSLPTDADGLQDRFGRQIAARLSDGALELPHEVAERLRAARVRAVALRRVAKPQTAATVVAVGSAAALSFGEERLGFWSRLAAALPLVALVIGLVAINVVETDNRTVEVAAVDTALLTDKLPPDAYTDPGFLQFLKSGKTQTQ